MIVPTEILNQHVAILGKTRSGKSSVMRGLVENLIDDRKPVCIVDPKGDWWGIKLAKDGKSKGFPVVIFGGEHADIPIDEHSGAQVAELFATGNHPCLIDMGGWMVAPRTRFWIDFASTLFKHTKGSRWLAIDEVHNFCPKGSLKGSDGNMAKALHWTNRLASEGLGKGLQMVFASQRPQKVHNDTLTSAETLIAMRVLHPSDRGAVSDWIKGCGDSEGSEVLNSLARMDRGEGWVWSPEIGFGPKIVKFPMFKTYDSFRPQSMEDTKNITGWAEVDIEEIRSKFVKAGERAKAEDPRELQKTIVSLKQEIVALKKAPPKAPDVPESKDDVSWVNENRRLQKELAQAKAVVRKVDGILSEYINSTISIVPADSAPAPRPVDPRILPRLPLMVVPENMKNIPVISLSAEVVGSERRILTVLAQYPEGKDKKALATISGYTVNGHFNNLLGSLRSKGFAQSGNPVRITKEGLRALGSFEPLPSGVELQQYWLNKVPETEARILRALIDVYPEGLYKEALASAAGYTVNGHFNNLLGHLRTIGIVQRGNPVLASPTLFE